MGLGRMVLIFMYPWYRVNSLIDYVQFLHLPVQGMILVLWHYPTYIFFDVKLSDVLLYSYIDLKFVEISNGCIFQYLYMFLCQRLITKIEDPFSNYSLFCLFSLSCSAPSFLSVLLFAPLISSVLLGGWFSAPLPKKDLLDPGSK